MIRFLAFLLPLLSVLPVYAQEAKVIRAGMIGLDTSHVPAFTRIFNNAQADGDLAGIRIVAGYPGGTDFPASRDRVEGFTQALAVLTDEQKQAWQTLLGPAPPEPERRNRPGRPE